MPELSEYATAILDRLASKTSFNAIPRLFEKGDAEVKSIIEANKGGVVLDTPTFLKLLNYCADEAASAGVEFLGLSQGGSWREEGLVRPDPSSKTFQLALNFIVKHKIQIFDVFSSDGGIYRIPYEVFHPSPLIITAVITVEKGSYHFSYLNLFTMKDRPVRALKWFHTYRGTDGSLCLGTLTSTFTNEGLDGSFLKKLLSSLEGVNLGSPARGLSSVDEDFEEEYLKLKADLYAGVYKQWRNMAGGL